MRAANPALTDGAQVHRYASDGPGIYAFSRVDRATGLEYLVVANNATEAKSATFATFSDRRPFDAVYGTSNGLKSARDGRSR